MEEIKEYYNRLAPEYDRDRFGNSYGNYLDKQEKAIVRKLLKNKVIEKILDAGCGTGRFLEFAGYGLDLSPEMIRVAQAKYPDKKLFAESITQTHFENAWFDTIICFHLFMHLDNLTTLKAFDEMNRLLPKGGTMIVDIPSKRRRQLVRYKPAGWHGANAFTIQELKSLLGGNWQIKKYYGIAFLPVHSIPKIVRSSLVRLDSFLGRTFLKEYSSYLVVVLEKK